MARKGKRRKAPKGCFWKGDWLYAQVRIDGRTYKEALRTGDEQIAEREAAAWRDRKIKEVRFGHLRKTYAAAFAEWSIHIEQNVSASTATRYGVSMKQLEPWLHDLFFDEVDRDLVGKIVAGRQGQGVTNATVRRDLVALSSLLAFHDVEPNAALSWLKKLTERRDPIVLPKPADIERVIGRAPGNFAHLIRTAWLTGCRQEELASALREHLDHERRQLTVIGKGSKRRTITLSDEAYAALQIIPARLGCDWLFWHQGKGHFSRDGTKKNDAPQRYQNVAARFREIERLAAVDADKAGRPFRPFRFHDLRHRFAVDYLKSSGSIYKLQKHLGHGSISTTELYLQFLTPEEAEHAKSGDEVTPKKPPRTLNTSGGS